MTGARSVAGPGVVVLYEPVPEVSVDGDARTSPGRSAGHMTLAIGVRARAQEGIVLVADGQVSHHGVDGHVVVDESDRVKVHDFGRFGVAFAGFTGLTGKWATMMARLESVKNARDIDEAQEAIAIWAREYMLRFEHTPRYERPNCSILLAGYNGDNEPRVYQLHQRYGFESAPFSWVGNTEGGYAALTVGRLLLEGRNPRPSLDVATVIGVMAVEEAHEADEYVGEPITVAIVTPDRGFEDVSSRLPDLRGESAALRARLRDTVTAFSHP